MCCAVRSKNVKKCQIIIQRVPEAGPLLTPGSQGDCVREIWLRSDRGVLGKPLTDWIHTGLISGLWDWGGGGNCLAPVPTILSRGSPENYPTCRGISGLPGGPVGEPCSPSGGPGSVPVQGTRSHATKLSSPYATKTQCSLNKDRNKKEFFKCRVSHGTTPGPGRRDWASGQKQSQRLGQAVAEFKLIK